MSDIVEIYYKLSVIYVVFMWFMFVVDNFIYLVLKIFKKEPGPKSQYAFADAFMQRGKDTEIFMAIINVAAHIGFVLWIIGCIQA